MWVESDWTFTQNRDEHGSMMWMDAVHVREIYHFVMANVFASILEIGCWDGFSTSALVQALRDGEYFELVLCDKVIRPHLKTVIGDDAILCLEIDSLDALQIATGCDCVILDGDHSLANVQREYDLIMEKAIPTIIAHDVGRQGDKGPMWLIDQLRRLRGWRIWMDDEPRPGMATQRGLMIATCDPLVNLPPDAISWNPETQAFTG